MIRFFFSSKQFVDSVVFKLVVDVDTVESLECWTRLYLGPVWPIRALHIHISTYIVHRNLSTSFTVDGMSNAIFLYSRFIFFIVLVTNSVWFRNGNKPI